MYIHSKSKTVILTIYGKDGRTNERVYIMIQKSIKRLSFFIALIIALGTFALPVSAVSESEMNAETVGNSIISRMSGFIDDIRNQAESAWGAAVEAAQSTLGISGASIPPDVHTQGQPWNVRGTVSSNYTLGTVRVSVNTSGGIQMFSPAASPNAKSYDISRLDTLVKFRDLRAESYVYKVTATDASGASKTLIEKNFRVDIWS